MAEVSWLNFARRQRAVLPASFTRDAPACRPFPIRGRASIRMDGRRELVIPPLPYIVVYQVKRETVEISRVFHGAQDWP